MRSAGLNKTGSPALHKKDVKTKNTQHSGNYALSPLVMHNLPPLRPSEVTDPHDDITLSRVIEALQNRHTVRQRMTAEYNNTACTMKTGLQEIEISLLSKNNGIHEQNLKLAEKEKIIQNNKAEIEGLKKKTRMQELKIGILENATKIYEDDKRSLQQELDTRQQRLQRELSDKRRIEQRMHNVVSDTQFKLEKECDRRVNAVELEMQNKLWMKEEKLRQLKAVVMEAKTQTNHPDPPPCHTQLKRSATEDTHLPATRPASPSPSPPVTAELPKNDPVDSPHVSPVSATRDEEADINPRPTYPIPIPRGSVPVSSCVSALEQQEALSSRLETQSPAGASASRSRRRAFGLRENEAPALDLVQTERCYRPTVQTTMPVHPLHCHPCCARGEKWVDHKPTSVVDLGTVWQPVIPNAIQVSAPSEKALSKCDRYVLTHQEVACDGEIQTQLIKGDVFQTRGGGQAVQFTDIETLKLELTTVPSYTRNTSYRETADEDQADGAWTDAELRYHVGLEMKAGSNIGPGYGHQEIPKCRKH